jgi:hypothetical protein
LRHDFPFERLRRPIPDPAINDRSGKRFAALLASVSTQPQAPQVRQ